MIKRFLKSRERGQAPTNVPLPVGASAPEFSLQSDSGATLKLSDLRGRPVVLVFYPKDNSSVCSSQLVLYNEAREMFEAHNARIVGISVDDHLSHQKFARDLKLSFPLLSDDDPTGETAKEYGVYSEQDKIAERALFVLDEEGRIHWRYVAPRGVNPGANGILEALESLDAGD
ncbi:MAG TPA: peroxiredoxin [Anaerolineae bacterium]|nr:peroxiredoxin [Anaerolineae bacterium]